MDKKKLTDIVTDSVIGAKAVCDGKYSIVQKLIERANEKAAEEPEKYEAFPDNFCARIEERKPREYLNELNNFYNAREENRSMFLKDFKEYLVDLKTLDATGILPEADIEKARRMMQHSLIAAVGSLAVAYWLPYPGAIVAGIFLIRGISGAIKLRKYAAMEKDLKAICDETSKTAMELQGVTLMELEEVLIENKEKIMEMIR